ncbi:MAG: pyruvate dehydrogenase, partial [Bacteroidetes bacterium]
MAEVITMPRLSDTMEEGTVVSWLKKVGDKVTEGDILAEIETDKATMEFESFYEGTLLHIGIEEGETANVDVLLAIIGEEGEDISALLKNDGTVTETKPEGENTSPTTADKEDDESITSEENKETSELPEGVEVITMPRLSDTMEEGTVVTWLKKEGDAVAEGDILAEIETDKATMEFESFYEGALLKIGIAEGESAKVDSLLAIIGPAGTDVAAINVSPKVPEKVSTTQKEKVTPADKKISSGSIPS